MVHLLQCQRDPGYSLYRLVAGLGIVWNGADGLSQDNGAERRQTWMWSGNCVGGDPLTATAFDDASEL